MSTDRDEPTTYDDVEVIQVTDNSLLCDVDGEEVWIPKSQLLPNSELKEESKIGDVGTLIIPYWLAENRGIE